MTDTKVSVANDVSEGAPPSKRQKTGETTEVPKFSADSSETTKSDSTGTASNTTKTSQQETEKSDGDGRKKKKQYKAKSSYIGDDEFEDILATGWFYQDTTGEKQGPFTTKEMKEWFVAGFFDDDLLVKRINEPEFGMIAERGEFKNLERRPQDQVYTPANSFQIQQQLAAAPNPYYQEGFDPAVEEVFIAPPPQQQPEPKQQTGDYSQKAFFTTLKGRFSATDQDSYWSSKGLPSDKEGRMLSNYFDYEAYQEQMRNAKPGEKKKVSKAQIKAFRKKKVDKKRRRILMM